MTLGLTHPTELEVKLCKCQFRSRFSPEGRESHFQRGCLGGSDCPLGVPLVLGLETELRKAVCVA